GTYTTDKRMLDAEPTATYARRSGVLVYAAFARVRFSDLMANRARFFTGIVSYFIYVSVYYAIYRAVYAGGEAIGGLELGEALTYVAVVWLLRSLYTNRLDRDITEEVRQGDIALALLRPVDYVRAKLAGAAGEVSFRALFFTLPTILVVVLVYPVSPPSSAMTGVVFLASTILAFIVYSLLNLLVGLTAVFTEHTVGLQRAKNATVDLLGGVLIPLTFYPEWAQAVLAWLPFRAVAFSPAAIYLGRADPVPVLLVQLAWGFVLYGLGRWMWRRAANRLTVQGG
ncbi:MAG: ABC-2 family transporter protein, partial [Trueperaceae bacterium]